MDPQTKKDLQNLLSQTSGCQTPLDELALIRAALRRYLETGDAEEAVAWAARELSNSLSR